MFMKEDSGEGEVCFEEKRTGSAEWAGADGVRTSTELARLAI